MNIAWAADVRGRFLCGGDTLNKPSGIKAIITYRLRHLEAPCLPSRAAFVGSVESGCLLTPSIVLMTGLVIQSGLCNWMNI